MALVVSWICAQGALAASSPDICAMACCVEQGHCCCLPSHASVKDNSDRPAILSENKSERCPDGCAGSRPITNLFPRDTRRAVAQVLQLPSLFRSQPGAVTITAVSLETSVPRGPPTLPV